MSDKFIVISILLTILLTMVIGLFVIGRWIIRKINKRSIKKLRGDKMQESTKREQLDNLKAQDSTINRTLNPILENKIFAWLVLAISIMLMFIDNFLKMDTLLGGWHVVLYLLLLVPLAYMAWQKELVNPYSKWFIGVFLVMIVDMFCYSNDMVQHIVPIVFYVLVVIVYLTSMHKNHSFYQTLIPRLALSIEPLYYVKSFFANFFIKNDNRQLYARIGLASLITLPVLGIFIALLFTADSNFENFLTNMVDFNFNFEAKYLVTVPLTFFLYLLLFLYAFSNNKERMNVNETKSLDMLIVGIFLGMIALLFTLFIAVQIPFLFGEDYLPENISLANFSREGFFQLMMVMGIVLLIFLFIMRRFKGEKTATVLLVTLLSETIIMGLVSLKKMYLYQSIKGATVLRYYVEWFDYFLIAVLALGIVFIVKKLNFSKLLDGVAILGVISFLIVISLNVDAMVASHNIEKFKDSPEKLDKYALSKLSIDALPTIVNSKLLIEDVVDITKYSNDDYQKVTRYWYEETIRQNCREFTRYHYGYCSKLKVYGENNATH